MRQRMHVGSISLDYFLDDDGEPVVGIESEGDLHLVTQLGMLDFARDHFLHPDNDAHDWEDDE